MMQSKLTALSDEGVREPKWTPYPNYGTNMAQALYEELICTGQCLRQETAMTFIADEFGFDYDRIHIRYKVHAYEIDQCQHLRRSRSFLRVPWFASPALNYVRFDCDGKAYELVNNEIKAYTPAPKE